MGRSRSCVEADVSTGAAVVVSLNEDDEQAASPNVAMPQGRILKTKRIKRDLFLLNTILILGTVQVAGSEATSSAGYRNLGCPWWIDRQISTGRAVLAA